MNEQKSRSAWMSGRKIVAFLFKILIAGAVFAFLALHTINFFGFTFKDADWYYAPLGFGLTGVGAIGYLIVFLWDADTELKKVISLVMVIICTIGEVAAAGFGMQIEAWARMGWNFTQTDFNAMLWVIRVLAFIHTLAFVGYVAGDRVVELFSDNREGGSALPMARPMSRPMSVPNAVYSDDLESEEVPAAVGKIPVPNPTIGSGNHRK